MEIRSKSTKLGPFFLFLISFLIIWTFRTMGPVPHFIESLQLTPLSQSLITLIFKIGCWVIPVFLYLKYVERVNPWEYLQLKNNWFKGILWGILIGMIQIIVYFMLNHCLGSNTFTFDLGISGWVNRIIFAGLTEETIYRGLILKKLMEWLGFYRANLLTSLLFLGIHFPGWIEADHLTGFVLPVSIFVLGFLFGLVLKHTKSLWSCIIVHSINNFVAEVISPFR